MGIAATAINKSARWMMIQIQKHVPFDAHNQFLEGLFAPQEQECTATSLLVHGEIPKELSGLLTRIGPNPMHVANPATYHWFMGDGMVHGLRLQQGQALWYRSRYVGTNSANRALGRPLLPGPRRGPSDVVNTNIIGHAGKLWALVEAGSYPVALDADLNTVKHGLFNSDANTAFTAHPHVDPDTGDIHAICYDALARNSVRYLHIDKEGQLKRNVRIPVQHGPMVHDCAITQSRVVIFDLPVTFSVSSVLKGNSLPYAWNPRHKARVGLLPRNGTGDDVRWFPVDPCFIFHACNAYDADNGDTIVDVVVHGRMFDSSRQGPEKQQITFERWILNNHTGNVQRTVISRESQEFPRLDERLTGKPYRYAYTISFDLGNPTENALLRHDMHTGETLKYPYGPQQVSGEVVFVPRHKNAAEDEGWLMSYVHDLDGGPSKIVILDAQKPGNAPQAVIELPVRVPLGFHGNWIAD
jgi:carotenoid cleavage dioxygenase